MATLKFKCAFCGKETINKKATSTTKYCSHSCYHKSTKGKKSPRLGCKLSEETKNKLRIAHIEINKIRGRENHPSYKKDRLSLNKKNDRNDGFYKEWRYMVWKRDNFTCRLSDETCNGKIEAHHIYPWRIRDDLRYEVSNGITLCKLHHPRKREQENEFLQKHKHLITIK